MTSRIRAGRMVRNGIIYSMLVLLLALLPVAGISQSRTWEVGLAGGAIYNFHTPLRIHQKDAAAIRLDARYKTEPFVPPVYYDVRVTTWKARTGWELKFTHHKLILRNNPHEVQRFSITDGFNLLSINRLWRSKGFIWSVGGGIVITHPESTVRNKAFPENGGILKQGYYVSGPTLEAAVVKRFYLAERWFVFGEGRATASYVRVPVVDGHAKVTNAAVHFLLGTGLQLNPEKVKPGSDRF